MNLSMIDKKETHFLIASLRGKWTGLLMSAGVSAEYLTGRHGPCPICRGGRDRFRYDNKDGSGSMFCNVCGARSGFGFLACALGFNSKSDKSKVFDFIRSNLSFFPSPIEDLPRGSDRTREIANSLWNEAIPLTSEHAATAVLYLSKRGLSNFQNVQSLRFHQRCFYRNPDGQGIFYPALIAKVEDVDGEFLGVQRIYLTRDGLKASITDPKKSLGSITGGAIRLDNEIHCQLGVSEGLETGLAARELKGIPIWATLSTSGMVTVNIPDQIRAVTIFADRDRNLAGMKAATELKARLMRSNIRVTIEVPDLEIPESQKGVDFLDALNAKRALEAK